MKAPKMILIPEKKTVPNEYGMESKSKTREVDPRPSFSVDAETFPAIKDWNVGKKYTLEVEVEMTGSNIGDKWSDNPGKLTASFKICGIMEDTDDDNEEDENSFKSVVKDKE